MSDFKVGDVLTPKRNSVFYGVRKDIRLVCRHEVGGRAAWLVEVSYESVDSAVDMITESNLREFWEKESTFFKLGHVYEYPYGGSQRYRIAELYSVDNPRPSGDKMVAIARATSRDGYEAIVMLTKESYSRMEEVK